MLSKLLPNLSLKNAYVSIAKNNQNQEYDLSVSSQRQLLQHQLSQIQQAENSEKIKELLSVVQFFATSSIAEHNDKHWGREAMELIENRLNLLQEVQQKVRALKSKKKKINRRRKKRVASDSGQGEL